MQDPCLHSKQLHRGLALKSANMKLRKVSVMVRSRLKNKKPPWGNVCFHKLNSCIVPSLSSEFYFIFKCIFTAGCCILPPHHFLSSLYCQLSHLKRRKMSPKDITVWQNLCYRHSYIASQYIASYLPTLILKMKILTFFPLLHQ